MKQKQPVRRPKPSSLSDVPDAPSTPPKPAQLVTGMLAVGIGVVVVLCLILLVMGGQRSEPLIVPQQQPRSAGVADGKSPDAFGRPPGDAHYGHDHP